MSDQEIAESALVAAIERKHTESAFLLLAVPGVDVNQTRSLMESALMTALSKREEEVARALIAMPETNVNTKSLLFGRCAIHYAEKCSDETLRALLDREDLNVNMLDEECFTPLMWFSRCDLAAFIPYTSRSHFSHAVRETRGWWRHCSRGPTWT